MPYRLNDFHLIWSSQFGRVSPSFTFSSKIPIRNIEVLFFSLSSLSSYFLPPFCHHLYTKSSATVFYHSLTSFFLSFLTLVYVSNLLTLLFALFCSSLRMSFFLVRCAIQILKRSFYLSLAFFFFCLAWLVHKLSDCTRQSDELLSRITSLK